MLAHHLCHSIAMVHSPSGESRNAHDIYSPFSGHLRFSPWKVTPRPPRIVLRKVQSKFEGVGGSLKFFEKWLCIKRKSPHLCPHRYVFC